MNLSIRAMKDSRGCQAQSAKLEQSWVSLSLATIFWVGYLSIRVEATDIVFRAGVIMAPPFALENSRGTLTGFEIDLVNLLMERARTKGTNLTFDFSDHLKTPAQYNAAFDLVSTDCVNVSSSPENCDMFDIIIGDYHQTSERANRAWLTPAWLTTQVSSVRTTESKFDSMMSLEAGKGTACVPNGTAVASETKTLFPNANYIDCPGPENCISQLANGLCSLYVDDFLLLRYHTTTNDKLELTADLIGDPKRLVWPVRFGYSDSAYLLLDRLLSEVQTDGGLEVITKKWLGSATPVRETKTTSAGLSFAASIATLLMASIVLSLQFLA